MSRKPHTPLLPLMRSEKVPAGMGMTLAAITFQSILSAPIGFCEDIFYAHTREGSGAFGVVIITS